MEDPATECTVNICKHTSLGGISLFHKHIPSRRQHLEEDGSTLAASQSTVPAESLTPRLETSTSQLNPSHAERRNR